MRKYTIMAAAFAALFVAGIAMAGNYMSAATSLAGSVVSGVSSFGKIVARSSTTDPTCATSTGDGYMCAENGIESEGVLNVAGASTLTGTVTASGALGVVSQTIGVDFSNLRIHDNIDAFLDQSAADDDDLTLVQGTLGTNATTLETIDCGGLADTPQYAAFWFVVPQSYVAGSTVSLKANAGMVTTVADQAGTLDFSCYVPDYANQDATVSSDLITTAAQSVNSVTFADKTFVVDDDVTGHVLVPGSVVQCRMTALCDDDGNAGNGITIRINRLDVVISS